MHLKNGFLASSRESLYIVQNNGFSLSWPNHANFSFLIAALCLFVCLFVTKLGCFDLYLAENNVFPFSFLNYAVFCFMALETCFHSFAVKFCCFNVMAPKKGFLFSVARLCCLRRCRTGKKVFFLFAANHTNFFSKSKRIEGQITLFLALMPRKHALVCSALSHVVFAFFHGKGFFISQLNRAVLSRISSTTRFFLFCC